MVILVYRMSERWTSQVRLQQRWFVLVDWSNRVFPSRRSEIPVMGPPVSRLWNHGLKYSKLIWILSVTI